MFAVNDAMCEALLTPGECDKRMGLVRLIGEREVLYQLELSFVKEIEQFKIVFFNKREYDYYALSVPEKVQTHFMSLWLRLNYRRAILNADNQRINCDLIKLDLGKYQPQKNASTL
jgi:hypothetical protein